jgi:NAD(P)-dependent dehydrogenase (short-subunit alcohol dehydrogenase family)
MAGPSEKVVLVTGANKGIGFEVARQIGVSGAIIIVGARAIEAGQRASQKLREEGVNSQFLEMDLTAPETIRAAARVIDEQFGRLDVLVNNAGTAVQGDGPPSVCDLSALEKTFRTNFFGTVAVTQAMLPLLRRSEAGRIVNVSSGLGSLTQNGDISYPAASAKFLGYAGSKAAINMLTIQLAFELHDSPIKVNSADPGFTATDMNGHRGTQTAEEGATEIVRLALLPKDGVTGTCLSRNGVVPW